MHRSARYLGQINMQFTEDRQFPKLDLPTLLLPSGSKQSLALLRTINEGFEVVCRIRHHYKASKDTMYQALNPQSTNKRLSR
jgi:hypothetical protein